VGDDAVTGGRGASGRPGALGRLGRLGRAAAAAALSASLLAVGLAAPGAAFGAGAVSFGTPTATSTFEVGIALAEPVTLPSGVTRVEALVRTGTSASSFVADVPVAGPGPTTLQYQLDTPSGSFIPNTLVTLQFRVTLADGSREIGPSATVRYNDTRFAWKTLSGSVVRVHWVDGSEAFGQRALSIGETAVANVSRLLGVTETEPIDFFIYADTASFYDVLGPGTRENVGGVAFPDIRTLLANIGPNAVDDPWVGIVIPHELTHLVFGTATANPYHAPPHWFNEGLAVYLSQGYSSSDKDAVSGAAGSGSLMPLSALDGQFPTAGDRFSLAYSESVSAIDYLIRSHGQVALVKLIKSYAGGVTDDEAFSAALGVDVRGFETAWLAQLGVSEPSPFGPQPAPAGPVPADWAGAGATPGIAAGPAASAGGGATAGQPNGQDLLVEAIATAVLAVAFIAAVALVLRWRRRRSAGGGDAT
jgi:Peptidase MA superfamily